MGVAVTGYRLPLIRHSFTPVLAVDVVVQQLRFHFQPVHHLLYTLELAGRGAGVSGLGRGGRGRRRGRRRRDGVQRRARRARRHRLEGRAEGRAAQGVVRGDGQRVWREPVDAGGEGGGFERVRVRVRQRAVSRGVVEERVLRQGERVEGEEAGRVVGRAEQ